jgi:hypothetical protein
MGQVVMAITAAQVSAGRKSLAKAVRGIARAREPMGGASDPRLFCHFAEVSIPPCRRGLQKAVSRALMAINPQSGAIRAMSDLRTSGRLRR